MEFCLGIEVRDSTNMVPLDKKVARRFDGSYCRATNTSPILFHGGAYLAITHDDAGSLSRGVAVGNGVVEAVPLTESKNRIDGGEPSSPTSLGILPDR